MSPILSRSAHLFRWFVIVVILLFQLASLWVAFTLNTTIIRRTDSYADEVGQLASTIINNRIAVVQQMLDKLAADVFGGTIRLSAREILWAEGVPAYLVTLLPLSPLAEESEALSDDVKEWKKQAREDSLTNFLNRKQFDAEMMQALEKQEKGTLFIIDLDGFKQVNDTFGHLMGDEVLKNSSQRIRLSFRKDDILSRYGGDEFIIYAPRLVDRGIIEQRLQVLQGLLRHTHALDGMTCAVTASIGIARFPADGVDRKTLFVNADSALYEAKRRGKDQYVFFSDLKKGR